MKVTSKNYDGKFYIKLGRKYIPLEQTVEYFENLEQENDSFQSKIKELQKQIEQMKNCHNCNKYSNEFNTISSNCFGCKNKSKWELAE